MKTKPSASRSGLLAAGNWLTEEVKLVEAFPAPGRVAGVRSQSHVVSGSPAQVLTALARLGVPFPLSAAGLVGKDPAGQEVLDHCRSLKVDTRFLTATAEAPTGAADANALWEGKDLEFGKSKARLFHLGCLLLLDALNPLDAKFGTKAARLLAAAQEAGMKTSLDFFAYSSESAVTVIVPALKYCDFGVFSDIKAGRLTGFKIRQPDGRLDTVALRHAAGAILQQGVRELVVIHFPEGAFARTRKGEDIWQPALKLADKQIVNRAGAGNAFCAGILLGLHEGWDLQRTLLAGVCAASAALTDAAGIAGLKPLNACLALAKRHGVQPPLEPAD